jgi:FkbM family methyltransferase
MEILAINLRGVQLNFSRENDFYPNEYYESVGNDVWEPATIGFFERNCDQDTVLIDVGAATGVLSMFAAKLGAEVIAFEPNPIAMSVLKRNIEINALEESITAVSDAISDEDSVMKFSVGSNSNVLSPIVMHGMQNHENTDIKVRNIIHVVNHQRLRSSKKIIVKMDIEGAEYKILCNKSVVNEVSESINKMFISFHPGFNRPTKINNKCLNFVVTKVKYVFVVRDHRKIFNNLNAVGSILNLDGKEIDKFSNFAGQLLFGGLDWVWVPAVRNV